MNLLKSTILLVIISFCAIAAYGQNSPGEPAFSVTGKVVDAETGDPLEYTTVSVHTQSDSTLVTGNVTDVSGKFDIQVPAGDYWLQIQFISYKTKTVGGISLSNNNRKVNVGTIEVAPDAETLSEIVVAGERGQMEMKLDKRVFNVAAQLTNAGRNASEILDNVPSVSVDVEGNISLRGSSNVRILVNGKPSSLVDMSSPESLRLLQGDLIDRIEVITNPSARYGAEGMAGIINIILKKEHREGINGAVNVNVGYPANYGAGVNINSRGKWYNLFGSYGISYRESPGKGFGYREFFDSDSAYRSNNERVRSGLSNNFRLGSDFYINDQNTLTVTGAYRISDEENTTEIDYTYLNGQGELVSQLYRKDVEKEDEESYEISLNYTRTFAREGQKLTADFQYEKESETEDADQEEGLMDGNIPLDPYLFQQSLNKEKDRDLLLQADYVHPFGEEGNFEAGFKSTIGKIETDYQVDQLSEAGEWVNQPQFTNHFVYDENIHAVYGIVGNKINRFTYQIGLRAEMTDIKTALRETNEQFDKDYINLFPSGHLTYDLKNENSLQASFSRRVNRPGYWALNPFHSISDARNIRTGNPDLDPEFTNSYELGYLKNWPTGSFFSAVYHRHTTDEIERIQRAENGITYSRPENLGKENAYGLEGNISQDITNWWQVNGNVNFYRAITEGFAYGQDLHSDTYSMRGQASTKLTFWKNLNYQLSMFYMAPRETAQGRRKSYYALDMALSKDVLKGNGTVTLSVRDLLNSRKYRSETFGTNFYADSEFQWRSRQVTFSLSYRINDYKSRRNRAGNGGGEGEGGGEGMDF